MRVSITGGTGCLGLPLINKFISIGANLKFLSLPDEADKTRLKQYGEIILGDINSESSLDLLTKNCDVVFHLAAKVHTIPRTKDEEQDFYKVNVEGTKKLLEAAKRNEVKRLIYYSTVGVYGKEFNFYGDELSPCNPNTVYSKSKYQAEKLVLESSKNGGPEGVVLRFPVVYGPEDRGNVARMIKAIRRNLFFYIGDGSAKRSIISSKNTAEAAFLSAFETDASNQIFCVTDGCDYSMEQLVDAICLILNKKWRPFHIPNFIANWIGKVGDLFEEILKIDFPINTSKVRKLSHSLTFSCSKAKKILHYTPVENLKEGLSLEVEWLKKVNK